MNNRFSPFKVAMTCALAVSISSCDGHLIPYAVPFERNFAFTLDTQAGTSQTITLTKEAILGDLDIPDDANIDEVAIESIHLFAEAGNGNAVTSATLSASYDDVLGDGTPASSVQSGIVVQADQGFDQPLLDLSDAAVARFRTDLEEMLLNLPSAPASMSTIVAVSARTPGTARLVLTGYVKVKMSAFILQCRDLSIMGIGAGTPKCEVDEEGG